MSRKRSRPRRCVTPNCRRFRRAPNAKYCRLCAHRQALAAKRRWWSKYGKIWKVEYDTLKEQQQQQQTSKKGA